MLNWFAIWCLFVWNCLQSQDISYMPSRHDIIDSRGDIDRLERRVLSLELDLQSHQRFCRIYGTGQKP